MSENVQGKSGPFSWLNENFEKIFMVTGLLAIILFITWQVIYRYIITQFIERAGAAVWTEELSRYIFIWISYLALSVAIRKRSSIRVDIIYDKLPERLQNISWIIVETLFLVLTGVITYFGWGQIERLLTFPQHTTALRIPFLVPYLILPLGFGLMCLRLLQRIRGQMRVCGALDSLLGFAIAAAIISPWYLVDYIDPLPVLFGYFALLCVIGVPIAISLGLSTLATIICSQTLPIEYMAQVCFTSIDSFPIMAIPFFIAAGEYMGAGGLSKRLLNLADEIVGGLYGGIGLTAVVTCMFFGAISGSGPATVAAIGALTIPAMIERGYDKFFSAALVAAAGCVGVMIPPSNPFVVYGVSSQVSIGDLFMAGVTPGILSAITFILVVRITASKRNFPKHEACSARQIGSSFVTALPALMIPVIIVVGITAGIFTVTESAGIVTIYALIFCLIKKVPFSKMNSSLVSAIKETANVCMVIGASSFLAYILTRLQLPQTIVQFITDMQVSKFVLLIPLIYILPAFLPDKTTAVYLAEPVADAIAVTCTAFLFAWQFKKALRKLEQPASVQEKET